LFLLLSNLLRTHSISNNLLAPDDMTKAWVIIAILFVSSAFAGNTVAPRYEDYPVTQIYKGQPAQVDFTNNPQARLYRTVIRQQAAEGPDFAGHYKITIWGCGSSCEAFAIVDSKTGRVYFPPQLHYVTWVYWDGPDFGLNYRINSRLLILHGSREERPESGTFYYLWGTNNTLRLLRSDLQTNNIPQ
jgi:hypothetical protein